MPMLQPYLNVESGVHPCLATKPETMFAVEDAPSTYIGNLNFVLYSYFVRISFFYGNGSDRIVERKVKCGRCSRFPHNFFRVLL